jgi:hypothetical protein
MHLGYLLSVEAFGESGRATNNKTVIDWLLHATYKVNLATRIPKQATETRTVFIELRQMLSLDIEKWRCHKEGAMKSCI